jgi:frataxin-like iron-binding protein CyaY
MSALSEQEFRTRSVEALEDARRALLPLADSGDGFEVELQNGVLNLVFEEPSEMKFVVSPNAPVRQIWVSAMSRSYKLAWAPELGAFALDGETLPKLLDRLARQFLAGSV